MIKQIFFDQVKPAYGCTEPIAIALSAAVGKQYAKGNLKKIEIHIDKNTYKNGLVVNIPGTNIYGLEYAAALGFLCGKSDLGLEVLKYIDYTCIKKAEEIAKRVFITLLNDNELNIKTRIVSDNNVEVNIKGKHDNIVSIKVNSEEIFNKPYNNSESLLEKIKQLTLDDILDYIENPDQEVLDYVNKTIEMNLNIANVGINTPGNFSNAAINNYVKLVSAAVDARMSGILKPVMTVAGSGNQGLSCVLPIAACINDYSMTLILKATLLSILVTIYIKSYTGLLSPICGAGIVAAAGSAAGLTYLKGGSKKQIKKAINDTLGTLFGLTCDGAKRGCALKAATGTMVALQTSELALNNIDVPCGNGIVAENVEETIRRVGKLTQSVKKFDEDVLDYIGKC
ncbi:MAG: serine dehydratase subunit alpha family protein [Thermosipho sp. (in: Bacteria)]|nr:serine dehydratase subunit alpha family protein [Thermosipho sp. (in: thermotogales)]